MTNIISMILYVELGQEKEVQIQNSRIFSLFRCYFRIFSYPQ